MSANYLIYYFVFDFNTVHNKDALILRVIATLMCVPLFLLDFSDKNLTFSKKLYWYFALIYCLPFFFAFMTFINKFSTIWMMNTVSATFLLIIILKLKDFILTSILGYGFAIIFYYIFYDNKFDINPASFTSYDIAASYFAIVIIGIFFAYNRDEVDNERQKYQDNIRNINKSLETTVQERTKELQKALAVKGEILDNFSHEIRTPMLGFTAMSDGLVNNWNTLNEKEKYNIAVDVSKSAERLSKFIIDILDISKFKDGKLKFETKDQDLSELIEEIIEEANTGKLLGKEVNIVSDVEEDVYCSIDSSKISQVLYNLIDNSIKYAKKGTEINISLKSNVEDIEGKKKRMVYFTIKDEGIGIPESEIEQIFEPFIQGSITSTKAGGKGLGLAISKAIIQTHNGEIFCNNYHEGSKKGAIFTFVLPHSSFR